MAKASSILLMVAAASALASTQAEASRKPDCSNTLGTASFSDYENFCSRISSDNQLAGAKKLPPEIRWDIVETCTCNIIRHEVAWAAMLDNHAQAYYLAAEMLINEIDETIPRQELNRSHIMFRGEDGQRNYLYNRLFDILTKNGGKREVNELTLKLMEHYSNIYYDPATMNLPHVGMHMGQEVRLEISQTCTRLGKNLMKILAYIDRLVDLSGNLNLPLIIANYDENLFKIMIIWNVCRFLSAKGQLIITDMSAMDF